MKELVEKIDDYVQNSNRGAKPPRQIPSSPRSSDYVFFRSCRIRTLTYYRRPLMNRCVAAVQQEQFV